MIVAVASGKGGTGKTTVATNLAVTIADGGERAAYVDCDVEEPNGHLFLDPTIERSLEVTTPVPAVDEARCDLCGACGAACRYSAILALPRRLLTFPKLCHGCGGCLLACPTGAIREVPRPIGTVEEGRAGALSFIQGRLAIGEAMAPPLIRAVIERAPRDRTLILDASPGTSCPVVEVVKAADLVLLVTDPTPFGLHDLELAVAMVRELGVPCGVVANRVGRGDDRLRDYCAAEQLPVLLELPDEREIASAYSRGELLVRALPRVAPLFVELATRIEELAHSAPPPRAAARVTAPEPASEVASMPSAGRPPVREAGVRELTVISGKGGTGKTSIVASFAALADGAVVADCDVDAADLHLVLEPRVVHRWPFSGGQTAVIDAATCSGCGTCAEHCRFDAVELRGSVFGPLASVDPISCEGCGVCADACPTGAARLEPSSNGRWFVSETRHGPLVHARLGVAQENSGKLVSLLRREAAALCAAEGRSLLICDGSPGIGCPVIASVTGARMALVVTEPTCSGLHDLRRVTELTRQLDVPTAVCINKVDLNPELADTIADAAAEEGVAVLGRVRYDGAVTAAQIEQRSIVEHGDSQAATDIRALWERVRQALETNQQKTDALVKTPMRIAR